MQLATITLIVEILFYLALCAGVVAQLRGKYKWHDRFQAPVVILNIFFILFVMIPTFRAVVLGSIPSGLSDVPVLVTAIHGLLGTIAQGLSIYCLLAGFKYLPRKIGVLRYWMRAAFAFWTLTILFGIGVYIIFYTGDTSAETVAEHDADLVAEHDAAAVEEAAEQPAEEVVAEHDEAAVATEEVVAEHDEAAVATEEVVAEHDEAAVAEATEPAEPPPPPTPVPVRVGGLSIGDDQNHGDQVTLELRGITPPPAGFVYEAWLGTPAEAPLSLGLLTVEEGIVNYTFTDPDGRNLLGLYSEMFISTEPLDDTDPNPSTTIAFSGAVPPAVIEPVRLAVVAAPDTPDSDGPIFNARAEVTKIELETGFQQTFSLVENDLISLKTQAEGIINILEGATGPNFGDSDGSGEVYNPGDSVGLLGAEGYLRQTLTQLEAASQAAGVTPEITVRLEQARTAVQHVGSLAEQLQAVELQILGVNSTAEAADMVAEANNLVRALLDGDGAGFSDPAQAGTIAAYTYVQSIGAIDIFAAPAPGAETIPDLISEPTDEPISEHDGN